MSSVIQAEDGLETHVELLPHQDDFMGDTQTRVLGLASGYGGGKTFVLSIKHIALLLENPGIDSIFAEPTNALLEQLAFPAIRNALAMFGIDFTFKGSPTPIFTCMIYDEASGQYKPTRLLCCSMENYTRLIGLNCSHVSLDEFDTTDHKIAYAAFLKLVGRLRAGNVRQMNIVSTPEGFRAMYQIFVSDIRQKPERAKTRRIIHAKTTDNPYVPPDFIEAMLDSYDEKLVDAYINGKFVNLKGGVVYYNYSLELSDSKVVEEPGEDLFVGQDFNVGHMASVIFVKRYSNRVTIVHRQNYYTGVWEATEEVVQDEEWHAVGEIADCFDTDDTISTLKANYQADGMAKHRIIMYPDASGKNRKSNNASTSDIAMLENAGFEMRYHEVNPAVRDRVNSVNVRFKAKNGARRLFVNVDRCPKLSDCLLRQAYDKRGEPEKGGTEDPSHMLDAFGYPIAYEFPIERPTIGYGELEVNY